MTGNFIDIYHLALGVFQQCVSAYRTRCPKLEEAQSSWSQPRIFYTGIIVMELVTLPRNKFTRIIGFKINVRERMLSYTCAFSLQALLIKKNIYIYFDYFYYNQPKWRVIHIRNEQNMSRVLFHHWQYYFTGLFNVHRICGHSSSAAIYLQLVHDV